MMDRSLQFIKEAKQKEEYDDESRMKYEEKLVHAK